MPEAGLRHGRLKPNKKAVASSADEKFDRTRWLLRGHFFVRKAKAARKTAKALKNSDFRVTYCRKNDFSHEILPEGGARFGVRTWEEILLPKALLH